MALLDILVKCGYRPLVAHFNHQIRPSASKDAGFTRQAADRYELEFIFGSEDIPALAERYGETLEEAARNGRYRFLFKIAGEQNAVAVMTAHQADDQVETILMNLLRGAGLTGIGGMRARTISAYHAEIPLVRPLLDCWREEILEYCRFEGLAFVDDETNQDTTYRRNRIRLELIPELQTYNPNIKDELTRMGRLAGADKDLLDGILWDALRQCSLKLERGYAEIALDPFKKLPEALQRYLIRHCLKTCFPEVSDLGSLHFEKACRLFNRKLASLNLNLNDRIVLRVEGGKGVLMSASQAEAPAAEWPQITAEMNLPIQPGEIDLAAGWKMKLAFLTREECGEAHCHNKDNFQAYLDVVKLGAGLFLRTWQAGDRYQPLGMGSESVKLSDFWIDHKVPLRAKKYWPLLFSGVSLVWIPGFQPAEIAKITAETREILHLVVFRNQA